MLCLHFIIPYNHIIDNFLKLVNFPNLANPLQHLRQELPDFRRECIINHLLVAPASVLILYPDYPPVGLVLVDIHCFFYFSPDTLHELPGLLPLGEVELQFLPGLAYLCLLVCHPVLQVLHAGLNPVLEHLGL